MNLQISYIAYLAISIAMTIWVARTLSRTGEVFLVKCFGQDEHLAKSTNHLLVVGFYLINIGFIAVRLDGWNLIGATQNALPYVGSKIGVSVLVLGAMHFFNMMMIARYGRTVSGWVNDATRDAAIPPLPRH
ncbi:hypothetical protein [Montanilutibacter psychrotolerans]|uniref:Uncharacterized protein n=1 Tax=Montanilutibacter psychrotolerans TaxID=1327343 RepID=A0A3M8SMP4_9GAMM|nr:hypothetical protein [Lysobacter psychrotolerans]RNF82648.1 hypothetical protein EER27_14205 [Lysobacter psychrotolerans]